MNFLHYVLLGFAVWWTIKVVLAVLILLVAALLTLVISMTVLYCTCFVWEFICCEIETACRPRPTAFDNLWQHWRVVAEMNLSSNEVLMQVVLIDADPIDDPLHPHASIIYAVGIQERNQFWRTITIWRVSTFSGQRTPLHSFDTIVLVTPFAHTAQFRLYAFQSRGVVFVYVRDSKLHSDHYHNFQFLLIYDTRFQKAASVVVPRKIRKYKTALAITCLGRHTKRDRTIDGWRIRFLGFRREQWSLDEFEPEEDRTSFVNMVVDVRASSSSVRVLHEEDLLFQHSEASRFRTISNFGLLQQNGRLILFNTIAGQFELSDDWVALIDADPLLREHWWNRCPHGQNARFPAVMTDREVVMRVKKKPVFIRSIYQPPTLKMIAAQMLFKANPEVVKMNAVEFLEKTGVDLSSHLSGHRGGQRRSSVWL